MSDKEERLIKAIFGPAPQIKNNGSEGVDDDEFKTYESAQDAIENA